MADEAGAGQSIWNYLFQHVYLSWLEPKPASLLFVTVTGWFVLAGASVDVSAKNLCQGVAGAEPIISNFTWLKVVSRKVPQCNIVVRVIDLPCSETRTARAGVLGIWQSDAGAESILRLTKAPFGRY